MQDSVPSHHAKVTQQFLRQNTQDFIAADEWAEFSISYSSFTAFGSLIFVARCYTHKRGLYAAVLRLSVCLASVTFVHCIETVKDTATVAVKCEQETDFEWYHFQ